MHDVVSRIPDYVDAFLGNVSVEFGLPLEEAIPRSSLDFSLASLRPIDLYLERVRSVKPTLPPQQLVNITLAAGSYLGEVIRRNARRHYTWLNYPEFFNARPEMVGLFPECLGTSALLAAGSNSFTLPINKVARFLDEGPENNLHYYASVEVRQ